MARTDIPDKRVDKEKQVDVKTAQKVDNVPLQDKMFPFNGAWFPSWDGALIGAENYQSLINFRYCEDGIKSTNGYFDVLHDPIVNHTTINSGIQFKTARSGDEYILLHAADSSSQGDVYALKAQAASSEGTGYPIISFDDEANVIVDNWGLDAKEFSDWTNTNSTDTANSTTAPDYRYEGVKLAEDATAGVEHGLTTGAQAMSDSTDYVFSVFLKAGDKDRAVINIEDGGTISGIVRCDIGSGTITTNTETDITISNETVVAYDESWYLFYFTLNATSWNGNSGTFEIHMTETNSDWTTTFDGDDSSYIYVYGAKLTAASDYDLEPKQIHTDASTSLTGRFAKGPAGTVAYANGEESRLWYGDEGSPSDVWLMPSGTATNYGGLTDADSDEWDYPVEYSEELTNTTIGDYAEFEHEYGVGGSRCMHIMCTRPLSGIKLYVDPSNANSNASNTEALDVEYWNGTAYANVSNLVDGTDKLQQTGLLSFSETTAAKPKHYLDRYLYSYLIVLEATSGTSSANIYEVTLKSEMQAPTNVWDGVYRQPIQCQFYDDSADAYEDYTIHVQDSSTVSTPVGLYIGQMTNADVIYVMFNEKVSAIKMVMLGSLVNQADAQIDADTDVLYWDGDSFTAIGSSVVDETLDDDGNSSFAKSGLIHWEPPSDEAKRSIFGSSGYVYQIMVDSTVTGTAHDDVVVDLVYGIPAQTDVEAFEFPVEYKNKLMYCSYSEGNEGNRIDFSVDNAPDVFNGADSSDDGFQAIYVGGLDKIRAATQLYNRFGSNIFSTLIILKESEVWLLTGDGPEDYSLYPISFTLGCPSPQTVATAEVGFTVGEQVERNIALWISHSGPVIFDGAILNPIPGLEKYFDPAEGESINFSVMDTFRGWFDSTYNEWNVLLAIGSSTTPDRWFVYDIKRKKWFEKQTGAAQDIISGFPIVSSTARPYTYGGAANGQLYELESGTSWDGTAISRTIFTGDFFPSNNQWDESVLRRIKLVCERISGSSTSVSVYYHGNTLRQDGYIVGFYDVTADDTVSLSNGFSFRDVSADDSATSGSAGFAWTEPPTVILTFDTDVGTKRLVRSTQAMNRTNWSHALRFEFESADERLKPIMWGYEWQPIRKDYEE